jgi:glycosyltransferase involved in cell wall biosynthesis
MVEHQQGAEIRSVLMKKLLIVTYYWPPSGGGGVQRWLKFVKYLPNYGWEPVVYTPSNQNAPSHDLTLLKDVSSQTKIIRRKIWEPYFIYRWITGRKGSENLGASFASGKRSKPFIDNLANLARSNIFIPDSRKCWIKPSVAFLKKILPEQNIDVIVTTGPPHSLHLIGLQLKRTLHIKWVADFRDPWTDIDYFSQLKMTRWAKSKHLRLEKMVIENCDKVLCVSPSNKQRLLDKAIANVEVITNGFDYADRMQELVELDAKFSLVHIGTLMANRNPEVLWSVLNQLKEEIRDFKDDLQLKLIGETDVSIVDALKKHKLTPNTQIIPPIPHKEAIIAQKQAQALLVFINKTGDSKGMVTGKVFEYIMANRPILAIGPEDGDLAQILKDTNSGVISGFRDRDGLKKNITDFYRRYKANNLINQATNLASYSRKSLSKDLAEVLNDLVK